MAGRWVVAFVLFAFVAGCGKPQPPAPGPQGLYDVHCAKCHARAGEPGGPQIGGSRGPDLSKIGGNKGRNAEWFAAWIRDPRSVNPDARLMPAFKDTLTEEQIRELAEWLAAKK
jgi:mono/diheme cytochrome c family protein